MAFGLPSSLAQAVTNPSRFVLTGPDGSTAPISELRESFRQGFVFEILNIRSGRTIDNGVFVLVLNPVRYSLSEPFQKVLTPAEDDSVVAEENGIITRQITIEGTFGLKERRASGFIGAQGNGSPMSGTQHFNQLRNFFRRYSAIKKDPAQSAAHVMIFHALRDDDHFVVSPDAFESPRDSAKTRGHYEYRISLTATDEATASGLKAQDDSVGFSFTDALRDINEAFNDARAAFAEVTANISAIKRKVGNIQAVMINAAQMLNAVSGMLAAASEFISLPFQFAANATTLVANAADQLVDSIDPATNGVLFENARSLRRMESAMDRILLFDERFNDAVDNIETIFNGESRASRDDIQGGESASAPGADGAGGSTIGTRTRNVAGSAGRTSGLSIPRRSGLREIGVERTDTIETIANEANTTTEAIILINDLRAPYLTESGGPGILKPGDKILVPAAQPEGGRDAGRGFTEFLTAAEALYGIDLALDRTVLRRTGRFEVSVDTAHDAYDIELARGVASIIQGTEISINTERGTTHFLPGFGIRRNIGTRGTTQQVLMASLVLREALLSDTRISGIQSSRIVFDGRTGTLEHEITPIVRGQRSGVNLVLPFGKASGGSE